MDDKNSNEELSRAALSAIDVLNRQHLQYEQTIHRLKTGPQARLGRILMPSGSTREKLILKLVKRLRPPEVEESSDVPSDDSQEAILSRIDYVRDVLALSGRPLSSAEDQHRQYLLSLKTAAWGPMNPGPCYLPDEPSTSKTDPLVKLIAFYLPQFHPIAENDAEWGRGFTEWSNVTRAMSHFRGHYQPHLPIDTGFYDLRVKETQERQVELAKQYGIGGFAFYYYWFGGKRLLDSPLNAFIENENIDFPFCLLWANENWTRRWDGHEDDVFVEQIHTPEADYNFLDDADKYFRHPNYIRIGSKPLLIIYKVGLMPNPKETVKRWRDFARRRGWGDLYLVAAQTMGLGDPTALGFDAALQFPPHEHMNPEGRLEYWKGEGPDILDPNYRGDVYSYPALVSGKLQREPDVKYKLFETAAPMWDNTARRMSDAWVYAYSSPELYRLWLASICRRAAARPEPEERIAFVNAWNEWAEGAHLEPDRRYGYSYLRATRDARELGEGLSKRLSPLSWVPKDDNLQALLNSEPRPAIVHEMGVVGADEFVEALRNSMGGKVVHVRCLNDLEGVANRAVTTLSDPWQALVDASRGKQMREALDRGPDARWNFVSLVQEPVSRNIAMFLRGIERWMPNVYHRLDAGDLFPDELHEVFLQLFDHEGPERWFRDQVFEGLDTDVLGKPFETEKGSATFACKQGKLLVLRIEDWVQNTSLLSGFLGVRTIEGPRYTADSESYRRLEQAFMSQQLSTSYVDWMHSTDYARHFYDPEELSTFAGKWMVPPVAKGS